MAPSADERNGHSDTKPHATQLQFALSNAQAGPYLHPFGRGHQHYQAMQPGGHIIPGVGAGMGRDLEHHHPGEHLAGLLGGNRKRPKYTRSKTGCLTCRTKKIKCDETKPICTKCVHGQRECTWPKDVQVNPSATSSTPSSRPSTTTGTPQRSPSRANPSSDISRSSPTHARAGSNFLSSSERGSSSAGTPSRETSPQERLDSHTRNSTEPRAPGLVVPHSGSSLSGLASDSDPMSFPQSIDMTSFGNSGVNSFPLSAQFGSLPMGYNDELSMLSQPLNVDNPAYSPWGPPSYGGSNSPIDTSTANGQWSATSNQLLTNPDPIAPFFRSVQERNLVLVSPSSYY